MLSRTKNTWIPRTRQRARRGMTNANTPNYPRILLLIFSALLVSSAFYSVRFPKIPFGLMMPFALIPLFKATQKIALAQQKQSLSSVLKKAIFSLWFFGFIVQLIAFFWVSQPILYFGSIPAYLAYPLFVFICVLTSFFFPLLFSPFIFSLCYQNKFPDKKIFILPIALAMTLLEIIIPRFLIGVLAVC